MRPVDLSTLPKRGPVFVDEHGHRVIPAPDNDIWAANTKDPEWCWTSASGRANWFYPCPFLRDVFDDDVPEDEQDALVNIDHPADPTKTRSQADYLPIPMTAAEFRNFYTLRNYERKYGFPPISPIRFMSLYSSSAKKVFVSDARLFL